MVSSTRMPPRSRLREPGGEAQVGPGADAQHRNVARHAGPVGQEDAHAPSERSRRPEMPRPKARTTPRAQAALNLGGDGVEGGQGEDMGGHIAEGAVHAPLPQQLHTTLMPTMEAPPPRRTLRPPLQTGAEAAGVVHGAHGIGAGAVLPVHGRYKGPRAGGDQQLVVDRRVPGLAAHLHVRRGDQETRPGCTVRPRFRVMFSRVPKGQPASSGSLPAVT